MHIPNSLSVVYLLSIALGCGTSGEGDIDAQGRGADTQTWGFDIIENDGLPPATDTLDPEDTIEPEDTLAPEDTMEPEDTIEPEDTPQLDTPQDTPQDTAPEDLEEPCLEEEELCDGKDNDCDGEIDEGTLCDDGNPCTQDHCGGEAGCVFQPMDGAPCDDEDVCTVDDACDKGVCIPGAQDSCDDENTCTTDTCDPDLGCAHESIPDCCGNGTTEGEEECDDGNQEDGDGCNSNCKAEGSGPAFIGYTVFNHNVCVQTFEETDAIMDAACAAAYGAGMKAASTPELFAGIQDLPADNNSGDWVIFKCPLCEGGFEIWNYCAGAPPATCRKGVNPGDPWPTAEDSGWNKNMCNADRTAVCVH